MDNPNEYRQQQPDEHQPDGFVEPIPSDFLMPEEATGHILEPGEASSEVTNPQPFNEQSALNVTLEKSVPDAETTPLKSPFYPATNRDWAKKVTIADLKNHASSLPNWWRRKKGEVARRVPAALLVGALALSGCTSESSEATPSPTTARTTAVETTQTSTPEVTKPPIEKNAVHMVISIGPNERLEEASKQSFGASEAAITGIDKTLRGSYEFTLKDAGVQNVVLTEHEASVLTEPSHKFIEESASSTEAVNEAIHEASILFTEKVDAAMNSLTETIGEEAMVATDVVFATVVIDSVNTPLYLATSGINGQPIETSGIRLYVNDKPIILRIVTAANQESYIDVATPTSVFGHELGHVLSPSIGQESLGHANLTWCKGIYNFPSVNGGLPVEMPEGSCDVTEYDDKTNIMGYSGAGQEWASGEWFNALQLKQLNVLKPGEAVSLTDADFASGQSLTYSIQPLSVGEGVKLIALPPILGDQLPVLDESIPIDATKRPYLVVTPEYAEPTWLPSGEKVAGKLTNYSLKVMIAADVDGQIVGSTYAAVLSEPSETSGLQDIGTPPKYLGDVFVDREGRKVSIVEYSKDGTPSITVKISAGNA